MNTVRLLLFCLPLLWFSTVGYVYADQVHHDHQQGQFRETLSDKELAWLDKKQTLKYVYDPDWPPFEWQNGIQKHSGIIADILNVIQNRTGIQLEAVNTDTWQQSVQLVKDNQADMFSAITVNAERKQYLNFSSQNIYSYPATLVTHFEDKKVYLDFAKDVKGQKIGIVKSSGLGKYIQNMHPEFDFLEVDSTHEGFKLLAAGKIDKFAINTVTARYFIENKGFDNLKIGLILNYQYQLKIAVNKDLPVEVISVLDKALQSIEEKALNDIFNKWTSTQVERDIDWSLVADILMIVAVVILLFLWNTRRLNQLVKEKTIELSSAVRKLDKLATIDPLTEIANRRKYHERLKIEMANVDRTGSDLSLMVIDVDDFKHFNDDYGHDRGDLILKEVARIIQRSLPRKTDFVARFGGEEFVVILPSTDCKGALIIADKIRTKIENVCLLKEGEDCQDNEKITVSIGLSSTNIDCDHLLFKQADEALYQAKKSGKNTIRVFDEDTQENLEI